MWQKENLLVLSNFFFSLYVFKKPSAKEASESVYMRERVNFFNSFTAELHKVDLTVLKFSSNRKFGKI